MIESEGEAAALELAEGPDPGVDPLGATTMPLPGGLPLEPVPLLVPGSTAFVDVGPAGGREALTAIELVAAVVGVAEIWLGVGSGVPIVVGLGVPIVVGLGVPIVVGLGVPIVVGLGVRVGVAVGANVGVGVGVGVGVESVVRVGVGLAAGSIVRSGPWT